MIKAQERYFSTLLFQPLQVRTFLEMVGNSSAKFSSITAFLLHLHPKKVDADTLRFSLSLGLGGMATTLVLLLFGTGVLQMISYSNTTELAYSSILLMYQDKAISGFIRNIHHWAGNLLVIISLLHLLRVYLTGGTDKNRRLNWLIGVMLFFLVLFANFTGYLLPWDHLAFWAATVFTSMLNYIPYIGEWLSQTIRGGNDVGSATLSLFFVLHVSIIPFLMTGLLVLHFWLIRKAGGLVKREQGGIQRLNTAPHLITREITVAIGVTALVFAFAALFDAPLAEEASPGESPNPAKAAWYFLGLQELMMHFHPTFAVLFIPVLLFGALTMLPYIKFSPLPPSIWCGGKAGTIQGVVSLCCGMILVFFLVIADHQFFSADQALSGSNAWMNRGLLPVGVFVFFMGLLYTMMRKTGADRAVAIMVLVMLNLGMIIGLTIIAIWFRGEGMALIYPV